MDSDARSLPELGSEKPWHHCSAPPSSTLRDDVEEAADVCPLQAIRIED
ncbi:hypothetical protein ABZZ80_23140 [Streptomyces sp. NPDC006356]